MDDLPGRRIRIGDVPDRCRVCGAAEPSGAPHCWWCAGLLDEMVRGAWRRFVPTVLSHATDAEQRTIAEMVVDEPQRHPWRIVDAAYDRLTCEQCAEPLSRGPMGCATCNLANGFRYAAIEVDRRGATPGNEHALRVAVAVLRRPHSVSAEELLGRRLVLPSLLAGGLPSTAEAQRARAWIDAGADEDDLVAALSGLGS